MNLFLHFFAAALVAFALSPITSVHRMNRAQQDAELKAQILELGVTNTPRPQATFPGVFITDNSGYPKPLAIKKLDVQVQITGTIATTTIEMTVLNPHNRILEGEFSFPVADGQTVSRFALDINGKLRDAVVVDKSKGRQTFEEVIRTKIDPALLEWTRDNSFRTRIYPIPPRGTRRVLIAYEQQLATVSDGFGYTIPFAFPDTIQEFNFHALVCGFGLTPSLTGGPVESVLFTPKGRVFEVALAETDILVNKPFTISVPVVLSNHQVLVQNFGNEQYAGIFLALKPKQIQRPFPRSLVVFWDASISGLKRDVEKELQFLKDFIIRTRPTTLELVVFSNEVMNKEVIYRADANALLERLREIPMDGGTQLGAVPFAQATADLAILCSDGISTFGKHQPVLGTVPVLTLASSAHADHAVLRGISSATGGQFINITQKDVQGAVADALTDKMAVRSVDVIDGRMDQLRPLGVIAVEQVTTITGRLLSSSATLRITTSIAGDAPHVETITINASEHYIEGTTIPRLWASQDLQRLSADRERNADSIAAIGRKFSIVTPGTSLIVLERIEDYVRFDIPPPSSEPELAQQFRQHRKDVELERSRQQAEHNERVRAMLKNAGLKQPLVPSTKDANFWLWPNALVLPSNARVDDLASLRGTIVTSDGPPIPGGNVQIVDLGISRQSNERGEFTFERLPKGTYQLAVQAPGYQTMYATATLKPQQTNFVRLAVDTINMHSGTLPDNPKRNGKAVVASTSSEFGNHQYESSLDVSQTGILAVVVADEEPLITSSSGSGANGAYMVKGRLDQTESDVLVPADDADALIMLPEEDEAIPFVSRDAWTETLNSTPATNVYATYLELRHKFFDATGFYLDVADALIAAQQPDRALRVLSALAELQGEDSRTLRILAHRLMQLKKPQLAVMVFEDVQRIRNEEPQSYRDLGLALAECGRYNEAVKQFLHVIEHPWHDRFPEVEIIAARELSRIVGRGYVDKRSIDSSYLIPYQSDVRVVLSWDADNCDMDLWVTDPDGETCKYNHRNTVLGGSMSRDLTGGYGPEEFVLPNAKKGAYRIQVHYYGDRQQNLARPTTVQVVMYTRYGLAEEQHDAVTMRVDGVQRVIEVGRVVVN